MDAGLVNVSCCVTQCLYVPWLISVAIQKSMDYAQNMFFGVCFASLLITEFIISIVSWYEKNVYSDLLDFIDVSKSIVIKLMSRSTIVHYQELWHQKSNFWSAVLPGVSEV